MMSSTRAATKTDEVCDGQTVCLSVCLSICLTEGVWDIKYGRPTGWASKILPDRL